ncbi:phospholipase [Microbacterium lacus]|uniref:aggregation-promoting factor C-terminal-like domain-containing protein n=1 Tax=Microbacterium lacus TaxID=415217 RepID=UPI00384FC777
MTHPQISRRALRTVRTISTARTTAFGVALGLVALTGLTSASAAVAVTQASAAPAASATTVATAREVSGAATLRDISRDAEAAHEEAKSALVEVTTIGDDIATAALDLGTESTTIDTSDLRDEIDRIAAAEMMPALLVPALTDAATAATDDVLEQVADLRTRLDEAIAAKIAAEEAARKAAEEAAAAAAAAQKAAEEAAAAAAAAEAQRAQAASVPRATPGAPANPSGAQLIARDMMAANYGWGEDQFGCLVALWNKESGWNYQAYNASSGATGIPQALPGSKMASAGADWQTNPATQIAWGLGYISGRYGNPCGAWGHSQSVGWY